MNEIDNIIGIIKEKYSNIQSEYFVKELGIFGSYIKGENNNLSDLDILIEYDKRKTVTIIDFISLKMFLSELTGKDVDLVTKSGLKPSFANQILQEVRYL